MIRHQKHLKIYGIVAWIPANMHSIWNVGWPIMQPNNFTSSMANNWKLIQLMWWLKCNDFWKSLQSWTIPISYDSMRKKASFVKSLRVIVRNVWVNRKGNHIRQWMIGAWKCYKGKRKSFLIGKMFWMARCVFVFRFLG